MREFKCPEMVIFWRSQSETLKPSEIKIPVIPGLLFLLRSFLKGSLTAYQSIISSFVCLDCQQVGHVNKEACVYVHFSFKTLSSTRLLPMVAPDLIWNTFRTYSKTNIHRLHCLINITRQLLKVKQRFEKTGWLARGFY